MGYVIAMSKIATLKSRNKNIDIFIRERKGKHNAPYIIARQPDMCDIHIRIDTFETFDDTGFKRIHLKDVFAWMSAYSEELKISWKNGKAGKATEVPTIMPKPKVISTFTVRRVREIKTDQNFNMAMRMDTGEIRVINFLKDVIPKNKAFDVLRDPKVFMKAKAEGSGIRWEKQDIDIEVADLYDISKPLKLSMIL
jgi:hypothetical protein